MARSGKGAANLLAEFGAEVVITDLKRRGELEDYLRDINPSIRLVSGSHPEGIFINADAVILSPGVPSDMPQVLRAKDRGTPVEGELELAYQIAVHGAADPHIPPIVRDGPGGFLGVTGTNGKSTTTALLDCMMRKGNFQTLLGGNIGNALTGEILRSVRNHQSVDYIVAEISSFQLETIRSFRPRGAAILNITPDHLDRYHSFQAYADAKARIFENQKENDFLVLNHDNPGTMDIFREKMKGQRPPEARVYFFSRHETVHGIYARNGMLFCNFPGKEKGSKIRELIAAEEIRIKGVHNLENAMAASAMALLAGCSPQAVRTVLREFPGLEHRLEFVRELNGVRYFNDSKGTNVGAVVKSLESFTAPLVLIAGGRDKSGDFSQLRELVRARVKALVLIGEAKEKIRRALAGTTDIIMADGLKPAVEISRNKAGRGDVVLLSPACASFDMFADFEDRGRQFKTIVMEMT